MERIFLRGGGESSETDHPAWLFGSREKHRAGERKSAFGEGRKGKDSFLNNAPVFPTTTTTTTGLILAEQDSSFLFKTSYSFSSLLQFDD